VLHLDVVLGRVVNQPYAALELPHHHGAQPSGRCGPGIERQIKRIETEIANLTRLRRWRLPALQGYGAVRNSVGPMYLRTR
jgi:hypothetical protein